jgi:hypothetical protein
MVCCNTDWIDLAQHRERWRTLVTTATNFGIHKVQGIS